MRKLRAFRPKGVEALEERLVLSHAAAAVQVASVRAAAHPTVPLGPVGTLGDSFTDEYRFYPPDRSQARGWVEILAATRGINFGSFSHRSRGEPRDAGFAYDWARSDSTTADMVRNQLPGLAARVARGQVKNVVILDGGNDFLLPLKAVGAGTLEPAAYAAALPGITAQAGANLTTAVTTLLASSPHVRLVISTIDISDLPIVRGLTVLSPAFGPLVQAVDQAVGSYNGVIRGLASSSPRVALVDLAAINQQLGQVPGASSVRRHHDQFGHRGRRLPRFLPGRRAAPRDGGSGDHRRPVPQRLQRPLRDGGPAALTGRDRPLRGAGTIPDPAQRPASLTARDGAGGPRRTQIAERRGREILAERRPRRLASMLPDDDNCCSLLLDEDSLAPRW